MSLATSLPFNRRIITDVNYIVSASLPTGVTPSLNFIQATPYPTTTERTILGVVAVSTNATSSGITASVVLQQSADNSTWTNITQKANPFITLQNNTASIVTSSVLTSFEPDGLQYVRASSSLAGISGSANITGSITLTVYF